MLNKSKNKQKTVAEKVADLLLHPNDSSEIDSSAEEDNVQPRIADFDVDEYALPDKRSTEFRKRNIKMLSDQSARYRGKVTSRKDLYDTEEESDDISDDGDSEKAKNIAASDSEDDDSDEEALAKFGDLMKNGKNHVDDDDEEDDDEVDLAKDGQIRSDIFDSSAEEVGTSQEEDGDDDEGDDNEDDVDEDDDDEDEASSADETSGQPIVSEANRQAELQKGFSVQNQLRIWEKMLELRIRTQSCLNKANQLPSPDEMQQTLTANSNDDDNEDMHKSAKECLQTTEKLLNAMINLQEALQQQNSELRKAVKRPSSENATNDDSSTTTPVKRFASRLAQQFDAFRPYRDSVLLKWDDRTRLLTPGKRKKSSQEEFNILQKIENALINPTVLVERSQVPKLTAGGEALAQPLANKNKDNDIDPSEALITPQQANSRLPHIYDDSDFYHQQLRELIEHKANTSSSMSEVTRQYVELQKLRQKMKRQVDTRASKGRKLRYVVHKKLVNFMAPIDLNHDWTDASRNELYKSLFS